MADVYPVSLLLMAGVELVITALGVFWYMRIPKESKSHKWVMAGTAVLDMIIFALAIKIS